MIKVSVIVPVYNVEEYLAECLDSIISQSLREIEILCINDGSTDSSREILEEYQRKDSRIYIIDNDSNHGLAYARNRGMEAARGEYLCYVDADDWLKDGALELLYDDIGLEPNLDGLLFAANCTAENEFEAHKFEVSRTRTDGTISSGTDIFLVLMQNNEYSDVVWCQFWKRTYLYENDIWFREDIPVHEDILFSFRAVMNAKKIKCINDSLYVYRRRENSLSKKTADEKKIISLFLTYVELTLATEHDGRNWPISVRVEIYRRIKGLKHTAWHGMRDLCMNGFDISSIRFENPIYDIFWNLHFLDHYAYISDFLPVEAVRKIKECSHLIVYGAGKIGKETVGQLRSYGILDFFVADTYSSAGGQESDIKIYRIEELKQYQDNCLVLIAVHPRYQQEIIEKLKENGFDDYVCMI